jgi:vacuolar-type H+-ATPase subunit I/STV1
MQNNDFSDPLLSELLTAPDASVQAMLENLDNFQLANLLNNASDELVELLFSKSNQKFASRLVGFSPTVKMRSMIKRSSFASLSKFLGKVQPSQLAKTLEKANNDLVAKVIDAAPSHNIRIGLAKSLPIERRQQWLKSVRELEREIGQTNVIASDAAASLYEERKQLLAKLDEGIRDKEVLLRDLDNEAKQKREHFAKLIDERRSELESLKANIVARKTHLDEQERTLAARIADFEEENRKQVQQRIEAKVPEYVAAAVRVLDDREILYRKKARLWSIQGVFVLSVAIAVTAAISLYGAGISADLQDLEWQTLLFVSFKGLVVLGVLGLWAKHAFTISNAYMHEAIKRSDRAHAINFGKLYLEIYGNSVDRKELVNIFENWNIASESAFARANPSGFSPEIIDKMEGILSSLNKKKKEEE